MKWFQHYSNGHTNIKGEELINCFGMRGYGLFWLLCELVANQGDDYAIRNKNWRGYVIRNSHLEEKEFNKILSKLADLNMIDKKSLSENILHIPKMADYSDDYTKRNRRMFVHDTDNVRQEENREDKNRIDKRIKPLTSKIIYLSQLPEEDIKYFTERFQINEKGLKSKSEDLKLYCQSKGKIYKNYKSFLLNAVKKDFGERVIRQKYEPRHNEDGSVTMVKVKKEK